METHWRRIVKADYIIVLLQRIFLGPLMRMRVRSAVKTKEKRRGKLFSHASLN